MSLGWQLARCSAAVVSAEVEWAGKGCWCELALVSGTSGTPLGSRSPSTPTWQGWCVGSGRGWVPGRVRRGGIARESLAGWDVWWTFGISCYVVQSYPIVLRGFWPHRRAPCPEMNLSCLKVMALITQLKCRDEDRISSLV